MYSFITSVHFFYIKFLENLFKYEPDLVLYLGYPYFKVNSSYVPLAYYQALYNPDTNTLKILTNSLGINGAFLSDDMELSAEEALDIIDKIKSFMYENTKDKTFVEQLNHYFSDILHRHPLVNAGILSQNRLRYKKTGCHERRNM